MERVSLNMDGDMKLLVVQEPSKYTMMPVFKFVLAKDGSVPREIHNVDYVYAFVMEFTTKPETVEMICDHINRFTGGAE